MLLAIKKNSTIWFFFQRYKALKIILLNFLNRSRKTFNNILFHLLFEIRNLISNFKQVLRCLDCLTQYGINILTELIVLHFLKIKYNIKILIKYNIKQWYETSIVRVNKNISFSNWNPGTNFLKIHRMNHTGQIVVNKHW